MTPTERQFLAETLDGFEATETPLPNIAEWEVLEDAETLSTVGNAYIFGTLFGILLMVRGQGDGEVRLDGDDLAELHELIDEHEAAIAGSLG